MGYSRLEALIRDDQPIVWIIPFIGLSITLIISIMNSFLKFLSSPTNSLIMIASSALVCSSLASYITELFKGRSKRLYITAVTSIIFGAILYSLSYNFLNQNIATGIKTASIPIIGNAISTATLTIIPGAIAGAIAGGAASLIPETPINEKITEPKEERITPDKWPGYQKTCQKCGAHMPFDSIYCSICGSTLKRTRTAQTKFCRYCGSRIYFHGEFCTECGKEINLISKPKVFVSL